MEEEIKWTEEKQKLMEEEIKWKEVEEINLKEW